MPFNLRKPFVRRQTDNPVIEQTVADPPTQYGEDGKTVPSATLDDGAISSGVDQLAKFKKTHKWDYNLDYETIVCLQLFGSPFYCVGALCINERFHNRMPPTGSQTPTMLRRRPTSNMLCSRRTPRTLKCELLSATTMRICLPTLSE